jgi:molybdate transport system substrate-binding protein
VRISGGIQKFLIFNCLFFGLISSCGQKTGDEAKASLGDRNSAKTELIVSAAASMQDVLQEIASLYNQKYPQAKIVFNFGSSGSLQHQIEQGAPVDIFISAAPEQMNDLAAQKLLLGETRQNLVKNQMVLIVPKNSRSIDDFSDLADTSVGQIALGEPTSVPAGRYAQEILTRLNIIDVVKSKTVYGKDVRQVLNYVATGNTDAGIVYRTDALDAQQVKIVDTASKNALSQVVYPVAIVKDSQHLGDAQQFLHFLFTAEAQAAFEGYGFIRVDNH